MRLSEQVARLETARADSGEVYERDLRVIEMQVARAEEKLLRREKAQPWRLPDLRLRA